MTQKLLMSTNTSKEESKLVSKLIAQQGNGYYGYHRVFDSDFEFSFLVSVTFTGTVGLLN